MPINWKQIRKTFDPEIVKYLKRDVKVQKMDDSVPFYIIFGNPCFSCIRKNRPISSKDLGFFKDTSAFFLMMNAINCVWGDTSKFQDLKVPLENAVRAAGLLRKITPQTKALVVINPNNPTGAVYQLDMLEQLIAIGREFDLVMFADEIYDKILFDEEPYIPLASLADDLLMLTFSGLSKSYRVAGFRSGWLVVSGARERALDYIEGLNILASTRLCANVPTQHAIQTALGGHQSIFELTAPGGRLFEQRNVAWQLLNEIDGISCVKPKGALYLFPKIDTAKFNIQDDEQFALDLLMEEKVLMVHGSGFNWPRADHFRIVFLPHVEQLKEALGRLKNFLASYRQ